MQLPLAVQVTDTNMAHNVASRRNIKQQVNVTCAFLLFTFLTLTLQISPNLFVCLLCESGNHMICTFGIVYTSSLLHVQFHIFFCLRKVFTTIAILFETATKIFMVVNTFFELKMSHLDVKRHSLVK